MNGKEILVIAGEASGDLHGAALMSALLELDPSIRFFGVGGPAMRQSGLEALYLSEDFAVMGLGEIIRHYRFFRSALQRIENEIRRRNVKLVILIDFPDFNFRVAAAAKNADVPIFYYIAPQVWAWRKGRAKTMAKLVDQLAVIFDFEMEFFKGKGLPVTFVGHPLLDQSGPKLSVSAFRGELAISDDETLIGLLPGSRKQEIERILPVMTKAAVLLAQKNPRLKFAVSCAPSLKPEFLRSHMRANLPVLENRTKEIMTYSKAAIVTSGTATLETALALTPLAVVYRTSVLTYSLFRLLVQVPQISLVNLVARKAIVPELIQRQATPENIAVAIEHYLQDKDHYLRTKAELAGLRSRLGAPGAAVRAAELAYRLAAPRG